MKLVIDEGPFDFELSAKAMDMLSEKCGKQIPTYVHRDFPDMRSDRALIEVVEELGVEKAGGPNSNLKIVVVPDEYDCELRREHFGENVYESVYLAINEKYLRKLIREGNEDEIINYVKAVQFSEVQ